MRKAVIQELRPKTAIEWIIVDEFVTAQFSAMRYGTWQAAVMQFSVGEGLKRAVKNQLRSGHKGSEEDLNWKAQEMASSMRPYVTCPDAARWTASINDKSRLNVAGIIVAPVGTVAQPAAKRRRANHKSPHGRAKSRGIWAP